MTLQNSRFSTGFSVPDTCCVVERSGYYVPAIGAVGGIIDVPVVSLQYCKFFATGHIPNSCCSSGRDDDTVEIEIYQHWLDPAPEDAGGQGQGGYRDDP